MQLLRRVIIGFLVIVLSVLSGGIANAIPTAAFNYVETDLGEGSWQYDYTLFNTSDPVADAGFDLYAAHFIFDSEVLSTVVSTPSGWLGLGGQGFVTTFSTEVGTPPIGADIAPGMSLSDFTFQFSEQVGDIPFDATFVNPTDPNNPAIYSGTTAPVPEPATILLLITGIVGIGVFGRKRLGNLRTR